MDSKTYWKNREAENLKANLEIEEEYAKEIQKIYGYMTDQITKEINGFYSKYASAEGITMAEAKKRVSELEIEEYERKAEKYVKEKDFSDQADEEMRLYNATMKINRLELLKAEIGLETVDGFNELDQYYNEFLTDRVMDEFERQAGILGKTVQNNAKMAASIVGASFQNATYSDRIWMYQEQMKAELSKLLQEGLIQGKNPRELATSLKKLFGVSQYNAERLMRTELARVQTDAQKQSFIANGFDEYQFNALGTACEICAALDGKHFKVDDMMPGTNAPPMHPNCRCSTSAYMDDDEYNEWLDTYQDHGLSFEDWRSEKNVTNKAKAIDSMSLVNGENGAKYTREDILQELQSSPIGQETIRAIRDSNVKIDIYDTLRYDGVRGDQLNNEIRLFSSNISNVQVAGQTLIHEMAHYRFNIGHSQHAEAVCFAMEKMHITGKNYLTQSEWEYVKKLAIDNYPEYNWEKGGYGDYEQFSFVKDN